MNEITLENKTYIAEDTKTDQEWSCKGCSFKMSDPNCSQCRCTPYTRQDGRNVIWIPKEP